MAWSEKIKGKKRDAVVQYILNQLEKYTKSWPLLKLATGEGFEKEHWKSLFFFLKLPKEVTIESLKFEHFLNHLDELLTQGE